MAEPARSATRLILATLSVPPHYMAEVVPIADPRVVELAMCESSGWPLTSGAADLVAERRMEQIRREAEAFDRYFAELAARPWWKRAFRS